MDTSKLLDSMKNLIENFPAVQANQCSDEFILNLNEMIVKATQLSLTVAKKREEEFLRKERRAFPKRVTVTAQPISSSIDSITSATTSNDQSAVNDKMKNASIKLKRLTESPNPEMKDILRKHCTIEIQRMTGSSSSNIGIASVPTQNDKDKKASSSPTINNEEPQIKKRKGNNVSGIVKGKGQFFSSY